MNYGELEWEWRRIHLFISINWQDVPPCQPTKESMTFDRYPFHCWMQFDCILEDKSCRFVLSFMGQLIRGSDCEWINYTNWNYWNKSAIPLQMNSHWSTQHSTITLFPLSRKLNKPHESVFNCCIFLCLKWFATRFVVAIQIRWEIEKEEKTTEEFQQLLPMLCLSRIPSRVIWFERDTSHHPASNSFDLIHSFPTHLQRISLHLAAAAAAATKCVSIEICSEYRGNRRGPNKTTHITYLPVCNKFNSPAFTCRMIDKPSIVFDQSKNELFKISENYKTVHRKLRNDLKVEM